MNRIKRLEDGSLMLEVPLVKILPRLLNIKIIFYQARTFLGMRVTESHFLQAHMDNRIRFSGTIFF